MPLSPLPPLLLPHMPLPPHMPPLLLLLLLYCRRGYDVFAFALAGASVSVGLDICPIAVQAAKDEQQLEIGTNAAACAASQLVSGDFFSHERDPDFQGPYDIGYDYTFLCALHPGQVNRLNDFRVGCCRPQALYKCSAK
jgi:hypothetical protein